MIALGLALVLIAGGATVFAVFASATSSTMTPLTAFGLTISASPLTVFLAGAVTVVLVVLGLALIGRGARRTARKRKELKRLRRDNATAASSAAKGTGSAAKGPFSDRTSTNDDTAGQSNGGTPPAGPRP